jgi:hypothetical protein
MGALPVVDGCPSAPSFIMAPFLSVPARLELLHAEVSAGPRRGVIPLLRNRDQLLVLLVTLTLLPRVLMPFNIVEAYE